ncbi:hypothetical protein KR222_000636 [Zaprionus bogoriensis]|nr:hypothetical protein KR222_000636 [Zaprionus bogoriensis]
MEAVQPVAVPVEDQVINAAAASVVPTAAEPEADTKTTPQTGGSAETPSANEAETALQAPQAGVNGAQESPPAAHGGNEPSLPASSSSPTAETPAEAAVAEPQAQAGTAKPQ